MAEDSGDAPPSLGAITRNTYQRQRRMVSSIGALNESDSAWTRSQGLAAGRLVHKQQGRSRRIWPRTTTLSRSCACLGKVCQLLVVPGLRMCSAIPYAVMSIFPIHSA